MEWPFRFLKEISPAKPPVPSIRRRAALLLGLLVLAVIVATVARTVLTAPAPHSGKPVPVTQAIAVAKAVPVQILTIGHVEPINTVAVRARVEGQVASVAIAEGQFVKKGDTLFQLDDRQARAALDQARAHLARDQAQLEFARKEVERQKGLAEKDYVSRSQYDQAKATADALLGTVASDEAQVSNAQTQLSFTTITAPIDGRVGSISVKEGNTVQPGGETPLVTINQISPIYVSFSVPQGSFAALRDAVAAGPVPVTAQPTGGTKAPARGTVAFYENAIDPATGTLGVKATFENSEERLWPGQFAEVIVTLRVEEDAVTVPSTAVQTGQDGAFVFAVKSDQTVEMRPVTVSRTVGGESVIAEGLKAGEPVVTSGQLRLVPGSTIRPVPEAVPPHAQGPAT